MKQYIFTSVIAFICICCTTGHTAKTDESHNLQKTIERLLLEKYERPITKLEIGIVYIDTVHLYRCDPGWVDGPDMAVNDTCYFVAFTTHTPNFNDGGYSDDYVLLFPFHKECVFKKNAITGGSIMVEVLSF